MSKMENEVLERAILDRMTEDTNVSAFVFGYLCYELEREIGKIRMNEILVDLKKGLTCVYHPEVK